MACENSLCKCTNCTYDLCACDGSKECLCSPKSGSCCCNK